jgi:hypothetical protein
VGTRFRPQLQATDFNRWLLTFGPLSALSMPETMGEGSPRSLLGPMIRRSLRSGRVTLVVGTVWSLILGVAIAAGSGPAFVLSFSLILPVFGSMGALGALTVFTGDRMKGVLEYLMAYGISPRRIFSYFLVASLVAVSIVLAVSISAGVGVYLARGNPVTTDLVLLLGLYAVPMSFVSAAFSSTVSMYWSALASPKEGLNSPIGIAPFLAIAPPVATLVAFSAFAATVGITTGGILLLFSAPLAIFALVVLLLLVNIDRLLLRERFLSSS